MFMCDLTKQCTRHLDLQAVEKLYHISVVLFLFMCFRCPLPTENLLQLSLNEADSEALRRCIVGVFEVLVVNAITMGSVTDTITIDADILRL